MATLLDLVNVGKMVPVGDKEIEVFGISTEGFIGLITEHPVLIKALSGSDVKVEEMMKLAPSAVAGFIAAGCGMYGDKKAIEAARKINVQSQLDLLTEIFKLSFPSGVGPFVTKLEALGLLARPAAAPAPGPNQSLSNLDDPPTNLSTLDTPTPSNTHPSKSPDGFGSAAAVTTENRLNS